MFKMLLNEDCRKITIIDTSNVSDYCPIGPIGYGDSTPRIIFTIQDLHETIYYSSLYDEKINEREMRKLKEFWNLFNNTQSSIKNYVVELESGRNAKEQSEFNRVPINCLIKRNILSIRDTYNKIVTSSTYFTSEDERIAKFEL